ADGEHPVTDLHAVGVAEFGSGQRTIHIDLDHGQVSLLVHADYFGIVAGRSRIFILQLDTNAIGFLHHVAVGDDVALGIHDHARTEGALADVTRVRALAAKELVKEILERGVFIAVTLILVWIRVGTDAGPAAVRILYGGLGIDVDHARLKLLGNLGKGSRELLGSGNGQRGCVRCLLALLALDAVGNDGTNQNSNRQRGQNRKSVRPTVGFETHPKGAFAQIHFFPPETA